MLTARRIGILMELGRGRVVTAPSLSERFGVTTKTIRRDIASLVALGAPVRTHLGRNGGWVLAEAPIPQQGAIRIVTPVDQVHRLLGLEGVRALVRAAVEPGVVRIDVVAADPGAAARAVALLPTPVRVEWPAEGSALLADVGRTLVGWYGAPGRDRDAEGAPERRPQARPPASVRTRIAELPSPAGFGQPSPGGGPG